MQRLDLPLIFGAFRHGAICPKCAVRGKRRGGFHLLFQRQEYCLFQLRGVQTHLVAAAFFVRFGMAAVIIRGFLHGAGQRMTAAATEGFALQRVVPLLFVGLGKAELAGLHGIKHGFLNDGRVMVGDDIPRFSILQAASGAAYFKNSPLADHIHAGVAFVGQNAENGGCTPNPVAAGNIMGVIAVRRLVFSGCRNTAPEKLPRDGSGVHAACGEAENELHNGSGLRVRLHSAIGAFAVAVGTDFALILTALHLGVLGALGFDGHIAAVILADEVLECHIHAAGVALEFTAVKIVADGNEAGVEKREHTLDEVAGFNAVSPEAGKILDNDAVDLIAPHQLNELLHLRTLEVRAAISVVDELHDLRVQSFRHGSCVLMEDKALIFNAQAVVLVVLDGEADVEGDHIFLHCSSTSA